MSQVVEKARLRKQLLDARDGLSLDFMKITSKEIQDNLRKIESYRNAKTIGGYYSIGSEVRTQDILQEILNAGKELALPKVVKNDLVFKKISSFSELEQGNFSVMEPKDRCEIVKHLDVVIVPAIALSKDGFRLGYGFGYYDRYLHGKKSTTIALSYAKQVIKSFSNDVHDVKMNFIVTEDRVIKT
ncbi:MAG TPA: 5-formyltetrahydrofolate cyclo-ligase [Nitrosopumilaceae archaeon]|nr:5-formyltetrahydrofolate cyclo-ligase [Nitrosopumilaceae archaeon]